MNTYNITYNIKSRFYFILVCLFISTAIYTYIWFFHPYVLPVVSLAQILHPNTSESTMKDMAVSKIRKTIYRSEVQVTFEIYGRLKCSHVLYSI